jgi:hypothetical protein
LEIIRSSVCEIAGMLSAIDCTTFRKVNCTKAVFRGSKPKRRDVRKHASCQRTGLRGKFPANREKATFDTAAQCEIARKPLVKPAKLSDRTKGWQCVPVISGSSSMTKDLPDGSDLPEPRKWDRHWERRLDVAKTWKHYDYHATAARVRSVWTAANYRHLSASRKHDHLQLSGKPNG